MKVLIIDDDSKNIFALTATLKARKFETVSAGSAEEGLALLQDNPGIGIVLMDMMMPDMDGYQAIAAIRSNKKISYLPVIAVTAQAMPGDREKCLAAGADHYIAKPIDVEALLTLLNDYIKQN